MHKEVSRSVVAGESEPCLQLADLVGVHVDLSLAGCQIAGPHPGCRTDTAAHHVGIVEKSCQ